MRDLIAAAIALVLLVTAASLGTTLQTYRRRRRRTRDGERALGRAIIAEIPADDDLVLFTEDGQQFHYRDRSIDKRRIAAVRILINGVPIAAHVSAEQDRAAGPPGVMNDRLMDDRLIDDRPEGIARDRWDVAIDASNETIIVECGAIRERVSQELARAVFDAVKRELEGQDRGRPS
jgi:hypothetical protein